MPDEVLIGVPDKKRCRCLTIMNTMGDFRRLSAFLASYDLPVPIGFEATGNGNYHHHLGRAGFDLKLVSSAGLARTRGPCIIFGARTTRRTHRSSCTCRRSAPCSSFTILVIATADIQELSKTHEIVSRSKTELWHRILKDYLPLYFSEAERFHRSSPTECDQGTQAPT